MYLSAYQSIPYPLKLFHTLMSQTTEAIPTPELENGEQISGAGSDGKYLLGWPIEQYTFHYIANDRCLGTPTQKWT